MSTTLTYITTLVYLISTIVYAIYLITRNDKITRYAEVALFGGFALNTLTIIVRWAEAGRTPVTSLHESLSFFAFITVIIGLVMLQRYKQKVLCAFISPFALLLMIMSSLAPKEAVPLTPLLASYWLPVHVALAFVGNAFFAIAFFLGIMYIIQSHYLKSRKLKGLYYILPSLDTIDELNYKCLQYGFPLLTLAIISGAVWSQYATGTYWDWKARQIWSLITWFLYAALLHGRLTAGWRGRKAAIFSGVAFIVLLGSFVIINLVLGGAHGLR